MDTPTPEALLAQINAVMSTYGLKAEFVDDPAPDHMAYLRPWYLNEETQLHERTGLNLPIVIKLTDSDTEPSVDGPDPNDLIWCPVCERNVPRKMWNSDPYFCDECCQEYC